MDAFRDEGDVSGGAALPFQTQCPLDPFGILILPWTVPHLSIYSYKPGHFPRLC